MRCCFALVWNAFFTSTWLEHHGPGPSLRTRDKSLVNVCRERRKEFTTKTCWMKYPRAVSLKWWPNLEKPRSLFCVCEPAAVRRCHAIMPKESLIQTWKVMRFPSLWCFQLGASSQNRDPVNLQSVYNCASTREDAAVGNGGLCVRPESSRQISKAPAQAVEKQQAHSMMHLNP